MSIDIDEGRTGPAAKFETAGDKHAGKIVAAERRQARDFATGQPKVWDNGDPVLQYVITIIEDGEETTIWAKGGNFTPAKGQGESMMSAIDTAVRAAGSHSIDKGGELAVVFSGLGKVTAAGMNPPKLFTAQYRPPTAGVEVGDDLFSPGGDDEPF